MYSLFAAGLMFPMTVAITPLYIVVREPRPDRTRWPASSCPQIAFAPADDDHHPGAVPAGHPRTRSRRPPPSTARSRLGFFWRMVVPLSLPGRRSPSASSPSSRSWNSYLLPLFILNDAGQLHPAARRAGVLLAVLRRTPRKVLAFTSLAMIPALVFFSIFERRIVGGLTGAVKG